jgi:LPXTG-motif cell wall-anchored protein
VLLAVDPSTTNSACSMQGTALSIDHVGSCVVTANQAGFGGYDAAPQVSQSILVGPAFQTVAFTTPSPTDAMAGGPSFTPTAAGTAGGTAIVIALDPSSTGCTLSGGVVEFTGAGSCTLKASRPGNSDYSPSPISTQGFHVSAGVVSFTTTSLPDAVVGQPYSFVLRAGGGIAPYTWTATGLPDGLSLDPTTGALTGTPTDAGRATITVTVTDSEDPVSDTVALRLTTDPAASDLPTTGVDVVPPLTLALLLVLIGSAIFLLRGRRRGLPGASSR